MALASCSFAQRKPVQTIIAAVLLTLLAAPGLLRLELRTDGNALVPESAQEVRIDKAIRQEFGVHDQILVVIETDHPQGIYNVHTLERLSQLTRDLVAIKSIKIVDFISLETERATHAKPYLRPFPSTPERMSWLREHLRELPLYQGSLVSFDESATVIILGVPDAQEETAGQTDHALRPDRSRIYTQIQHIVAAQNEDRDRILISGAPVAETLLGRHILEDLKVLMPIVIALMMLLLFFMGRTFWAVVLPMSEVGAALIFTFGVMGWVGVPVYLTTAILPVILCAMGIADEIHILTCYRQLLRTRKGAAEDAIVAETMREMRAPVVKTSLTTSLGFLAFALSPIAAVQMFGVFSALGVLFCMLWSLSVMPAALTLLGSSKFSVATMRTSPDGMLGMKQESFEACIRRYHRPVLLMALMLIVFSPFGLQKLFVQDSWLDGFAAKSSFRQDTEKINKKLNGVHLLRVHWNAAPVQMHGQIARADIDVNTALVPHDVVSQPNWLLHSRFRVGTHKIEGFDIIAASREANGIRITTRASSGSLLAQIKDQPEERLSFDVLPHRDRLLRLRELKRIRDFEEFMETQPYVGGVNGTWEYLATANFLRSGHRAGMMTIDKTRNKRPQWALKNIKYYLGQDRRFEILNKENTGSLVTVFIKSANFIETEALMKSIRTYEAEHLTPHGIRLQFSGDVAVSQAMIPVLVNTQVTSLLISLLGVWLISLLLQRSLLFSLLLVMPTAFAVCVLYTLMGLLGMPLGVATSMFGGICIGLGVDYAVHFIERFRYNLSSGVSIEAALHECIKTRGMAISVDALVVGMGFGLLMLSQVPANQALGMVAGLCVLVCYLATMLMLPAMLYVLRGMLK